ncbi:MAG: COQ9 family protein, partial [Pseudomonadota bacterium]
EFLDRRIDNVMQIEKVKARVNDNPVLSRLMAGPNWVMSRIKAPSQNAGSGLPGSFGNQ